MLPPENTIYWELCVKKFLLHYYNKKRGNYEQNFFICNHCLKKKIANDVNYNKKD